MRSKLLLALACFPGLLLAQDGPLSQYLGYPLYHNKAMAGSMGCSRYTMGMRFQWMNVNDGYRTGYVSYDQYSRHINSGFGIEYYNLDEGNGTIRTDAVHLTLAPHFPINRKTDTLGKVVLKPAIDFGYIQNNIDQNRISYGDFIDPYYGFIYDTQEGPIIPEVHSTDFGAGFVVYGASFYGGVYIHHLTSASLDLGYDILPMYPRLTVQGGYALKDTAVLGRLSFLPSFLYEKQGSASRLDITLTTKYRSLRVGACYRLNKTAVAIIGFENKDAYWGYSYEVNRRPNHKYLGTTHEFNFTVKFGYRKEHKKIRTLDLIAN